MQGFFHEVALDFVTAQDTKLAVLANAAERRGDDGNLLFTRLTIFKATDRRRYERELVEARAAAERGLELERATSELREQFIAVLGHDLRNPLSGIEAGLRLIERKGPSEVTPELIGLMQHSVSRINGLIEDVLDLARSRLGGGFPLEVAPGQYLAPTLTQVIDELQIAHPERVIDRHFDLAEPVDCDQRRIGQLLSNLVGNAVSHGDEDSSIHVSATARGGQFDLKVANRGEPIPTEVMERLFQPFYRGKGRSRHQGLGLGLFIASQIARAHNGELSAVSTDEETVFTLRMPTGAPTG